MPLTTALLWQTYIKAVNHTLRAICYVAGLNNTTVFQTKKWDVALEDVRMALSAGRKKWSTFSWLTHSLLIIWSNLIFEKIYPFYSILELLYYFG